MPVETAKQGFETDLLLMRQAVNRLVVGEQVERPPAGNNDRFLIDPRVIVFIESGGAYALDPPCVLDEHPVMARVFRAQ
jgi:hypothetical protein